MAVTRGIVNAKLESIVRVRVRGPGGATVVVNAIVDTGFSAAMALPLKTVITPGLVRQTGGRAVLADGSVSQFDVFQDEINWDGTWQSTAVSAVGREPLLGMGLLAGNQLRVAIKTGGAVEIAPLP